MPTIAELRKWLRGEASEAISDQSRYEPKLPTISEDFGHVQHAPRGGKYKISASGDDALLLFGKYHGQTIKELAEDANGIGYLRWMLAQEFPTDLKDVVMFRLGMKKR